MFELQGRDQENTISQSFDIEFREGLRACCLSASHFMPNTNTFATLGLQASRASNMLRY